MERELDIGSDAGSGRERRRRRRKSTASSRSRAMRFDRRLLLVMSVVLVAYVAVGVVHAEKQVARYGGVALGATHDKVRYLKGPPTSADAANSRWVYEEGGTINTIDFTGDSVSSSSCELAMKDLIACPAVFGIGAGTVMSDLIYRLGPPDRSQLGASGLTMSYDGLGYAFLMREETVIKIVHHPRGDIGDYLRDVLWQIIP